MRAVSGQQCREIANNANVGRYSGVQGNLQVPYCCHWVQPKNACKPVRGSQRSPIAWCNEDRVVVPLMSTLLLMRELAKYGVERWISTFRALNDGRDGHILGTSTVVRRTRPLRCRYRPSRTRIEASCIASKPSSSASAGVYWTYSVLRTVHCHAVPVVVRAVQQ